MATKLANRREKKLVLQQLNAHILGIKGVKANIHTGKGGALEKCETLSGTCHYEKRSSDVRSLHVQPSKRLNGNRAYSNIHEVPPFHLMHTCRNTCTHTCTHTHTHTHKLCTHLHTHIRLKIEVVLLCVNSPVTMRYLWHNQFLLYRASLLPSRLHT